MNFDFYYGIISLFETIVIFLAVRRLLNKLKSNQLVFLASFYNKKGKSFAFFLFMLAIASLTITYGFAFYVSLSDPLTLSWEYGNIITFALLAGYFMTLSE